MARVSGWRFGLGVALVLVSACRQDLDFDPPDVPEHDDVESDYVDGYGYVSAAHADGKGSPFLCGNGSGGRTSCLPGVTPDDADLSCDASGCHGDMSYSLVPQTNRELYGSDGPSCYACHGREWSDRK